MPLFAIQTQTWHLQSISSDNVEISSAKSDIGASIQKQTNVDGWNVHWAVLYKISGFKMIENRWHQNGV
jgi:hypothetical protein